MAIWNVCHNQYDIRGNYRLYADLFAFKTEQFVFCLQHAVIDRHASLEIDNRTWSYAI